jgi:hypothetical protein
MLSRFAGTVYHVIERPTGDRSDPRFWKEAVTLCGRRLTMPFPISPLPGIPRCKQCAKKDAA